MNPKPDLTPMLRKLRMDGVLQSLEVRNRQAIESRMSYVDFLSLLVSDEVARREQRSFETRLRRAAFRSSKTIEQFDFDFNPTINTAMVHDLMTCRFIDERAPALIVGPCGTGKSHLAQAIGHEAVRQDHNVRFTTAADLLGSLYAARATGSFKRKFRQLAKIDLLIIDDFGLRPMKPPPTRTSTTSSPSGTSARPPWSPRTWTSPNGATRSPTSSSAPPRWTGFATGPIG